MVAYGNDAGASEATGFLLREVVRLHARVQREQVTRCGTTVAQCHILTEISRGGSMAMTELGLRLGLHKGWISRAVAGLVREGFLHRTAGADGRVVVLELTRAGRRKAHVLNRSLDAQATRVLRHFAAAEQARVHRALTLVRSALRQELHLPDESRRVAALQKGERR